MLSRNNLLKVSSLVLIFILCFSFTIMAAPYMDDRSLEIDKPSTTAEEVGWISGNQAQTFWNGMQGGTLYHIGALIKTEGVNTSPADSTEEIGLRWEFYDSLGNPVGYSWIPADQSVASKDWDSVHTFVTLSGTPDSVTCFFRFGKDATGTAWADDFILSSSPWTAGFFGADVENPRGWMEWHSTDPSNPGWVDYTDSTYHSGSHSAFLMDKDTLGDEIVFYSIPNPCTENELYLISSWVKTENVNHDPKFIPSNITGIRDNDRIGFTFFYHYPPIYTDWSITSDEFFYVNQMDSSTDWTQYWVVDSAPAGISGVSFRARYTSNPTGTSYYDDFSVQRISLGPNIIQNGDMETYLPFWFYHKGTGATLSWATDSAFAGVRSLKVEKASTTAEEVGWISGNQAQTFWNGMQGGTLYHIGALIKTAGVNTSPADSTEEIGLRWEFYDSLGNPVGYSWIPADQSVASKDWDSVHTFVTLSGTPDSATCFFRFGKDATGTAWADNFFLSSSPWTAGFFGWSCETPREYMYWVSTDPAGPGHYELTDAEAHSGTYSAMLQETDTLPDELVFYSIPYPCEPDTLYLISAWLKTEGVNTDPKFLPTNVTGTRDNDRLGVCFFFHNAPLYTDWSITSDQFFYANQVDSSGDWTKYQVVARAPSGIAGVSMRARFTSNPTGTVYYDDFEIRKITKETANLIANGDMETNMPFWFFEKGTGATLTWAVDTVWPAGIEEELEDLTHENKLFLVNSPNPFTSATTIKYALPQNTHINLKIYDMLGREIITLLDKNQTAGLHTVRWNGRMKNGEKVPGGIYFYRLSTVYGTRTSKMVLIK